MKGILYPRSLRCLSSLRREKADAPEHVVILGAGIGGLCTAHHLLAKSAALDSKDPRRNLRVTLIDKFDDVAEGASKKNGQLLCPSLSYSWTSTPLFFGEDAVVTKALSSRFSRKKSAQSPVSFEWKVAFESRLWTFGMHWLLKRSNTSTHPNHIQKIMKYSMQCFDDPTDSIIQSIDYGRVATGTKLQNGDIATSDSSGDIGLFCKRLRDKLVEKHGERISLHLGETIEGFLLENGTVNAVKTSDRKGNRKTHVANKFVVALGTGSYDICRSVGVQCPVFPVKGYLVTITSGVSIPCNCELLNKAFASPMGEGKYRLSGFADFVSDHDKDTSMDIDSSRVESLVAVGREVFPDLEVLDVDCCYRPVSPDDVPMIGSTKLQNFYLCTGHGSKGWTMGPGSGKLLADLMLSLPPEIDPVPFSPRRFDLRLFGR